MRRVARGVFQAALPPGFVERGEDALLEIDGRFPASDDGAVDAKPADVDAF